MNKPIAPKMTAKKSEASSTTNMVQPQNSGAGGARGCRRKIAFHPTLGYAVAPPMPAKVARRNARERNRVKQVNCGFEVLRAHIPTAAKAKKMSKVDTLKHAVEYIQILQQMLSEKESTTSLASTASGASGSYQQTGSASYQPPNNFAQPPLTPNTPTTSTSSMCFPTPTPSGTGNGNESGYDTASSFYSATSPSPMSDLMSPSHPHSQHSGALIHHPQYQHSSHVYHSQSPTSAAANSNYDQQYSTNAAATSFYHEANSEEDELLDVIAKWQED